MTSSEDAPIRDAPPLAKPSPSKGSIRDYVSMARFDHFTKHVFILPGIILAYALRDPPLTGSWRAILVGLCSAVLLASANYVINEWLDREYDSYHPSKSARAAVQRSLSPPIVYAEYLLLSAVGLVLASFLGMLFFYTSLTFLLSGIIYNATPFRTKDRVYADVVSESINNPIRLTLGWTMLDPATLPPSSLIFAYWMGGAFLMGAKRLSEYREIAAEGRVNLLHMYRRSFRTYTEETLTVSCFLYAILCVFFLAVFLIKYRIEYVLAFPFIAILFCVYLWLAMRKGSVAQRPERLFHSRRLMVAAGVTVIVLLLMTFIDLPWLETLSTPHFIGVSAVGS
jgi:4-hydroxybenzoate polyprenyltransferase